MIKTARRRPFRRESWLRTARRSAWRAAKVLAQLKGVPAPPMGCTTPGENRGAIWVNEFPAMDAAGVMKGRARYSEPMFRKLVHQGILWAVHRLE